MASLSREDLTTRISNATNKGGTTFLNRSQRNESGPS